MPVSTRSTVLGKRHAPSEPSPPSSPSANESNECGLFTPDTTPSAKRVKITFPFTDDGSNKENIPPFKVNIVNASPDNMRTPRALRRTSTIYDSSPSRRTPRRQVSMSSLAPNPSTPATALSGLLLTTPPPSPPSVLLPISARARALLRVTTHGATAIAGREEERGVIQAFIRSLPSSSPAIEKPSLYISGSPGSGKTALVTSILREMRAELDHADIAVVALNCMALGSVDALWTRLMEAFEGGGTKTKAKANSDACFRRLLSGKSRRYVLLLDELDNVASSAQSLTTLFNSVQAYSTQLRLIGIANTHTLTSLSSSHSTASASVQTLHFRPYSSQQLLGILRSRLSSLSGSEQSESVEKFLPLPTLTLLSKKVAALTGDVRAIFEVLRGAIDLAGSTTTLCLESPTPSVTPSHILQALKAFSPTTSPLPITKTPQGSATSKRSSDSEIVTKVEGLGLQARLSLLMLLLAHNRLEASLPLSGSSLHGTPRKSGKTPGPGLSGSSACIGVDESQLYTYYSTILNRSENQIFRPVSRSEFSDLLGMLETVGLIAMSSTGKVPGSPSKSGRRGLARSASFSVSCTLSGGREMRFVEGLRVEEVVKGLGLGADRKNGESIDVKEEEVRSIWLKESSKITKETKCKGGEVVEPFCG